MLTMEIYKDYLLIGVKFEKLDMIENAKIMYKHYLNKIAYVEYTNIIEYFYGTSNIEVENYEEAINKAYLIEKLKKLYLLIYKYRINWIDSSSSNEIYDETLISFFKWVASNKSLSNSNLKIINDMIETLEKGCGFDINFSGAYSCSLFDTVSYLQTHKMKINGKELYLI